MSSLTCKVLDKINRIPRKMSDIKYPEFLNTIEKYNKCVRNTLTVKQFEDVFCKLLDDDTIPMVDCIKIMAKLEHDTITTHGNKEISCIMDMAEAIINYHYITSKEKFLTQRTTENQLENQDNASEPEEIEGHFEPDSGVSVIVCPFGACLGLL